MAQGRGWTYPKRTKEREGENDNIVTNNNDGGDALLRRQRRRWNHRPAYRSISLDPRSVCAVRNAILNYAILVGPSRGAVFHGASVVKRRASSAAGGRPWACWRGSRSWPSIGRASCWTRGSEFVRILDLDVATTTMRTAMTMAAGT
jgi:hypothetical protein